MKKFLEFMKLGELVLDDGMMMALSSSCLNPLYLSFAGAYAGRRNRQELKAGKACSVPSTARQFSPIAMTDLARRLHTCGGVHWFHKRGFDFDGSRCVAVVAPRGCRHKDVSVDVRQGRLSSVHQPLFTSVRQALHLT